MKPNWAPRVIRLFPDYGRDWPLWENGTPERESNYTMTPEDYGGRAHGLQLLCHLGRVVRADVAQHRGPQAGLRPADRVAVEAGPLTAVPQLRLVPMACDEDAGAVLKVVGRRHGPGVRAARSSRPPTLGFQYWLPHRERLGALICTAPAPSRMLLCGGHEVHQRQPLPVPAAWGPGKTEKGREIAA
ncbi:MAG: hypothetical protein M3116_06900 [Actinomycetota bacterium]|nr:hypothetical protein [Actinomycetota bacterium]